MLTIVYTNAEHRTIHSQTGQKKLKCELCGKTFDGPATLSYHKSVEHSQGRRTVDWYVINMATIPVDNKW
jgi:hypothetical protein